MSNESKYNLSNAQIGIANIEGNVYGDQVGFQQNNTENFDDLKQDIHALIEQLMVQNLTPTQRYEAIRKAIYQNPTLKKRLQNALKAGGVETLKQIFNHPVVHIPVEVIKGWLEAE